jgi:uncharacterized membrane protein YedE/YeeE
MPIRNTYICDQRRFLKMAEARRQLSGITAEGPRVPRKLVSGLIKDMPDRSASNWNTVVVTAILVSVVVVLFAAVTGLWAFTAIPIGFLFGFFMERSDLCGASAFSEVVVMKDAGKLWGFWVAIATSMALFALGAATGLITLSPKPLMWASYLVGGLIFGVGTVLAGGCVSGCLFKAGQGNLNSMAALVAMPIGMSAVAFGPLSGFNKMLSSYVIKSQDGGPITLSSITGLPYWLLAILISVATLAVGIIWTRKSKQGLAVSDNRPEETQIGDRIFTRRWKPWHSGVAIGVLALLAYTSSAASGRNYPLGVTHGVLFVMDLATESSIASVWSKPKPEQKAGPQKTAFQAAKPASQQAKPANEGKHTVVWWLVFMVFFVVAGSHVSARMRGNFNLRPKPPEETLIAFAGGLLVGIGAWLATACVIGHILSGVALMSVGSLLFAFAVVLANWVTTYGYLMGGFSR